MHIPGEVRQAPVTLPFGLLLLALVASVVVTVVGVGIAAWLLPVYSSDRRAFAEAPTPQPPPQSTLGIYYDEIRRTADGVSRHEAGRRALDGYGWVDRARGVVHVPIDVAIEMLLEQERKP